MSWRLVIPFKGAPGSKSRLAARYNDATRHALALAFLRDTVDAARRTPGVTGVTVVSSEPGLAELFPRAARLAPVELVPDPGHGLNGAIARGIRLAQDSDLVAAVAALLGDLPELRPAELEQALAAATRHPLAYVADAAGSGTTLIALAPGEQATPHFGRGSAAAHAATGFIRVEVPVASGLRRDVDSPGDIDGLLDPGAHTRAAVARLH